MTTVTDTRWVARGFTDDVTTCDHCGRDDLKGTVRMVAVDPDGGEDGEQHMGVVCASKMTGRKAAEIRTEAARADRERVEEIRRTWREWSNARTDWFCALRDTALGVNCGFAAIQAWQQTGEYKQAEAAWLVEHPQPVAPREA